MPSKRDLPCSDCGQLLWRSVSSLPEGLATCQPCRRARPRIKPPSTVARRAGAPCPICGQAKTSDGDRPCRKCDHIGSRKPRECEVCSITYKPSHSLQRACGRSCGRWIKYLGASSPVEWRDCGICSQPYTPRTERAYGTCSTHCSEAARKLLFPKPERDDSWKHEERECPICAALFRLSDRGEFMASTTVHCSSRCSAKAARRRRRVREAGSYGEWRWSDFMRVAAKFNYCCAYCGDKPERLDPDHVVPLSKGGPNIIGNLLPVCLHCNSDKQAHSLEDWATHRAAAGKPPRRTSWAPEDRRYWHLTVMGEVARHAA